MTKNNSNSKDQKKLYVLMFVLIAALVGAVIVSLIFSYKASKSQTPTPAANPTTADETKNKNEEGIDTSDWLTYENKEYGYSVKYPRDWRTKIKTEDTPPSQTLVLINLSEEKEKKLDEEFQKMVEETGGTDVLPKTDFYKIWIKVIEKDLNNSNIRDWLINNYFFDDNFPAEEILISNKPGLLVKNLEWTPHLIAAAEFKENKIISFDRYLIEENDEFNIKIFKQIILSLKEI